VILFILLSIYAAASYLPGKKKASSVALCRMAGYKNGGPEKDYATVLDEQH
jgi:hypothetical protein